MSNALEQMIGQAIALCQQNKFAEAEVKLKGILGAYPDHLPALNISGLVFAAQSKHKDAAAAFKKALKFDPKNASLHYNLAKALQEIGEDKESLQHHKKVIQLSPNNLDARLNLGKSLCNLGDFENALVTYSALLKISPNSLEGLLNFGATLKELERYEEALASYDQALALNPNYYEAWSNRGVALKELKRYEEALISYDQALSLNSNYFEAWSNRGVALAELKRYEEALASYDKAIALNPNYYEAWSNQGLVLAELKRYEEALASYDKAIALNPNYYEALFNKGILELHHLNFADGWAGYEYRSNIRDPVSKSVESSKQRWTGSKDNARLLLWSEQGIGDQILYCSMLPDLKNFPQKKIITLDPRLIAIFSRSFPEYSFLGNNQPISDTLYDEQIPIGSLGQIFRNEPNDFLLTPKSYLKDDCSKTEELKSILQKISKKTKCGICWKSSNPKLGSDKSIPLMDLLPILENQSIDFVNLQHDGADAEILDVERRLGRAIYTLPEIDLHNDIDGVLSLIKACDFIITISNTVAHIAGACGKEVLLLLPYSVGKFWYWQDIKGVSLFYPSVKVFQQTIQGNWSDPIQEVKKYLDQLP